MALLIRDVRVGRYRVDVRVEAERIAAIGPELRAEPDDEVLVGDGGALIPGLHDHHLHILALAAALDSVRLGPPAVHDAAGFAAALAAADQARPDGSWLRGVGYHASVAGPLDRHALDAIVANRPLRVQDRSGAQWTVNSVGVEQLGLDTVDLPGVDRDDTGGPTGRLHRLDDWLQQRLPQQTPDLRAAGALLAQLGVTGFTDATPFADLAGPQTLGVAASSGALPQRVVLTGGPALADAAFPDGVTVGPVKVVLSDPDLPALEDIVAWVRAAHAAGRAVAVHSVTRESLVLALAAWEITGSRRGDRIEHAAIAPPELVARITAYGLTVVTQPGFVAERGDRYRAEVDPRDVTDLYPCGSLLAAGVQVGGSTDAPFGEPDPWAAMRAATDRRTASGFVLGPRERIGPSRALDLFLTAPQRPGGPPRTVAVGQPADLVLLTGPFAAVLADPRSDHVAATIQAGRVSYRRR